MFITGFDISLLIISLYGKVDLPKDTGIIVLVVSFILSALGVFLGILNSTKEIKKKYEIQDYKKVTYISTIIYTVLISCNVIYQISKIKGEIMITNTIITVVFAILIIILFHLLTLKYFKTEK